MTIAYPSPPTTAPLPCMAQVSHLKVSARHAPASPAIALRSQSRQTNLRLLLRRPPTAAFPSRHRFICLGSSDSHNHNISDFIDKEDKLPVPIVSINQHLDYKATMVEVRFGHNPNALEDLIIALKDLGLEVVKGSVSTEAALTTARLFVTRLDTGCKVENARLLEMIHLATIDSMQKNQVHALPCQNIGDSHLQDKRIKVKVHLHQYNVLKEVLTMEWKAPQHLRVHQKYIASSLSLPKGHISRSTVSCMTLCATGFDDQRSLEYSMALCRIRLEDVSPFFARP